MQKYEESNIHDNKLKKYRVSVYDNSQIPYNTQNWRAFIQIWDDKYWYNHRNPPVVILPDDLKDAIAIRDNCKYTKGSKFYKSLTNFINAGKLLGQNKAPSRSSSRPIQK